MKPLIIEATEKTPKVILNADINVFEIVGRSITEDAPGFYKKILDWVDEYAKNPHSKTKFVIDLEYFNTTSSKCILDLSRKLEK